MSKLIIANWKSHKTLAEVSEWLEVYGRETATLSSALIETEVLVAPSFPFLSVVAPEVTKQSGLSALVAQDCSPYPFGAYTGAVAAKTLQSLEVEYVLLGHSERRQYFGETDALVANKVTQVLDAGMTPIICVDEPYLSSQASALDSSMFARCVIAYEPLEAIGSGTAQPVAEVTQVVEKIHELFGEVPVIYGGSVTHESVREYLQVTDGVLVGGASLDPHQFATMVKNATAV